MTFAPRLLLTAIFIAGLSLMAQAADFDRDGKADFAFFRPSTGVWYAQSGSGGFTAFKWGIEGDVIVPADYDGDRITDVAVWRPETGDWYIRRSTDDSFVALQWGQTTMHPTGGLPDVPVPADYDGDGISDIAVWRPDTGQWFVLKSSARFSKAKADISEWGRFGDVPVPADYDGDGKTDIGVFRSWERRWYIRLSGTGSWYVREYGLAGDMLVPSDYTGDGKADLAVYREGTWFVLNSTTGEMEPFQLGFADATPAPADYDGDGQTDFAVYRKGVWYIYESGEPRLRTFNFGNRTDLPLNSASVRKGIAMAP